MSIPGVIQDVILSLFISLFKLETSLNFSFSKYVNDFHVDYFSPTDKRVEVCSISHAMKFLFDLSLRALY